MKTIFTESQQTQILNAAAGLNFWRKQLDTSKEAVAGQIADQLFNGSRVKEIFAFCQANAPVKAPKQTADAVPVAPEYTTSDQHYKHAPRLPARPRIVFSIQNNAKINGACLATARVLANELGADLLPVACSYMVGELDEVSHTEIPTTPAPCWMGGDNILILNGDVLPTAKKPISNAALMSGDRCLTVLPHPKQQAMSLPRAKGAPERWALTTGTLCEPRYRVSRAGAEASADHVLGFTVINTDGTFDQVQLNEHGQGFYRGLPINEFGFADPAGDAVITAGDIHAEKLDNAAFNRLLFIIKETDADAVILQDLLDFTSRSHHNRGSGLFLASQQGRTIADDIRDAAGVISALLDNSQPDAEIVIVNSNHDRALDRWLDEVDPRHDPVNLPLWCDIQGPRFKLALDNEKDSLIPLERAMRLVCPYLDYSRIKFLNRDESYIRHGVEFGHHGDVGINGSRGGFTAFERLGGSFVIGHSHSGYKNGKRVAVGGVTGSFEMGYNVGASSWSHSHVVTTADGAMQIIKG